MLEILLLLTVSLTKTPWHAQFSTLPKPQEYISLSCLLPKCRLDGFVQVVCILGDVVAQLGPLQMRPQILDRVDLRSIWRQRYKLESGMVCQNGLHCRAAMRRPAVPYHNDAVAEMAEQLSQEIGDTDTVKGSVGDCAEVNAKATAVGRQSQPGDDRHLLSALARDEKLRRLSLWCKSAANERAQHDPAFVNENNSGPLAARPF